MEAKIELAAEMTTKRHRMSLHKAAEITDMAGTFKDSDGPGVIQWHLAAIYELDI